METTTDCTNQHTAICDNDNEFTPSQIELLARMPQSTRHRIIKEVSQVAIKCPNNLRDFISEVLRFYLITAAAEERAALTRPEPPEVKDFWQIWDKLESAGHIVNHAISPALISFNMTEFIQAAEKNGHGQLDRTILASFLPLSRNPKFVHHGRPRRSRCTGKTVRCWVFQRVQI